MQCVAVLRFLCFGVLWFVLSAVSSVLLRQFVYHSLCLFPVLSSFLLSPFSLLLSPFSFFYRSAEPWFSVFSCVHIRLSHYLCVRFSWMQSVNGSSWRGGLLHLSRFSYRISSAESGNKKTQIQQSLEQRERSSVTFPPSQVQYEHLPHYTTQMYSFDFNRVST